MNLTPRQREMLYAVESFGHVHVSLCDMIDPDFRALSDGGLVDSYPGMGASRIVHLTDEGKKLLDSIDK